MAMFVDQVDIEVQAGDGGNGMVTFRKEKFVPRGGPSGGDGGHGGSVVLQAGPNLSTLMALRYHHKYKAPSGWPRPAGSAIRTWANRGSSPPSPPPGPRSPTIPSPRSCQTWEWSASSRSAALLWRIFPA